MARSSLSANFWLVLFCLGVLAVPIEAHRLDECLQAALIEITPTEAKVQLNLNPGVQVAEAFLWMIDRDHDGTISAAERKNYARSLLNHLSISLDRRTLTLQFVNATFDSLSEFRNGTGNIRVEMRVPLRALADGEHVLTFENRDQPELSVYLVNAVLPKFPSIRIQKQERNDNQSIGRIYFSVSGSTPNDWNMISSVFAGGSVLGIATLAVRRLRSPSYRRD